MIIINAIQMDAQNSINSKSNVENANESAWRQEALDVVKFIEKTNKNKKYKI
jgi:hypothetical protein